MIGSPSSWQMRLVVVLLIMSTGLNLAVLGFHHLRADRRAALIAALSSKVYQPGPTVLLGDSIMAEIKAPESLVNLALPGVTSGWIGMNQIELVVSLRPSRVLLAAGINDLRSGTRPEDTAASILALADRLESAVPNVEVIVFAILPPVRRAKAAGSATPETVVETNRLILLGAAKRGLAAVDHSLLFSDADGLHARYTYDGLHLNAAGLGVLEEFLVAGLARRSESASP